MRSSIRVTLLTSLLLGLALPGAALGFCGFYVAKADTQLFNRASKVVLARDGDRTVLTMASDYQGDPTEFALVVPVPTFLERGQIHVADRALVDHLDAYTAPRLVEYFDDDPCRRVVYEQRVGADAALPAPAAAAGEARAKSLGVTIEARYTVGEYDILVLSAKESDGLETWLVENGYRIPAGASRVLAGYIRQKLRFFVARVNLEEQSRLGYSYLRPIQVAYESPRFGLPIRLGTVNADGTQELFVFALTRTGRVETTNYRTVKLPSGQEIPPFVEEEFGEFYRAMFARAVEREDMRAVFLEYAWDMGWCDPCAADPLTREELRGLGVFWLQGGREPDRGAAPLRAPQPPGGAVDVFVTRLHVRYDAESFPEDLVFQETGDRQNFQGRYVLRHPWTGTAGCEAAREYRRDLLRRQEEEAKTLAHLTGWELAEIRRKMALDAPVEPHEPSWWERLWGEGR